MRDWIPVSERLPQEEGEYLICLRHGKGISICNYAEGWNCYRGDDGTIDRGYELTDVVAWMPLPDAYEG